MGVSITIHCDSCGRIAAPGVKYNKHAIYLQRSKLRRDGWTNISPKDFCPRCKPPAKPKN